MDFLIILWEGLIFIISLGIGILIFRMISKEYEWDTSYKTAFIVVFLCTITGFLLFLIPILIIIGLQTFVLFNDLIIYILIPMYIAIFGLTLYIGILIIKRFYKCEFRESFSMLRLYLFYDIILMIPLFPFLTGILWSSP